MASAASQLASRHCLLTTTATHQVTLPRNSAFSGLVFKPQDRVAISTKATMNNSVRRKQHVKITPS